MKNPGSGESGRKTFKIETQSNQDLEKQNNTRDRRLPIKERMAGIIGVVIPIIIKYKIRSRGVHYAKEIG
jgi:hypothetical protein